MHSQSSPKTVTSPSRAQSRGDENCQLHFHFSELIT